MLLPVRRHPVRRAKVHPAGRSGRLAAWRMAMPALRPERQTTARRGGRLVRSAAFQPGVLRVTCLRPVALLVRHRDVPPAQRGSRPEAVGSPEPRPAAAQQVQRREAVGQPAESRPVALPSAMRVASVRPVESVRPAPQPAAGASVAKAQPPEAVSAEPDAAAVQSRAAAVVSGPAVGAEPPLEAAVWGLGAEAAGLPPAEARLAEPAVGAVRLQVAEARPGAAVRQPAERRAAAVRLVSALRPAAAQPDRPSGLPSAGRGGLHPWLVPRRSGPPAPAQRKSRTASPSTRT